MEFPISFSTVKDMRIPSVSAFCCHFYHFLHFLHCFLSILSCSENMLTFLIRWRRQYALNEKRQCHGVCRLIEVWRCMVSACQECGGGAVRAAK